MEPGKQMPEPVKSTDSPIRQFVIKIGIVTIAIIVIISYVDNLIEQRIEQIQTTVKAATGIGGRQFWTKLERELENQASPASDLSAEKKQKIIEQIRIISDRWRPFVMEARSAVVGDSGEQPK